LPTLSIFTLAYLFSLLLFHSQAEIPWLWHTSYQVLGYPNAVLGCWILILFFLIRQGGMCSTKTEFSYLIIIGFITAQWCTGIQAAAHQSQQIPLKCNKQIVESTFQLVKKSFRNDNTQTWLIRLPQAHLDSSNCLKPNAKLQILIEKPDLYNQLLPGQYFNARIQIKPPKTTLQLQGFDVHQYWFANQIAGTAQLKGEVTAIENGSMLMNPLIFTERARLHIANWLVDNLHEHPEKALVLAMVVGDQGLISMEDRDMFNATGIAHLVAISGLHITLFAMLAGKAMSLLWRRSIKLCLHIPAPIAGSAFGLLFAVFYGLIAGWGVPAQRTIFMLLALFIGQLRGGSQSGWDTFFLALFLTLAFDNWAILDAGFILSFGAVALLIFITQGHYQFIKPQYEFFTNAVKAQYTVTVGLILPCSMLFNQQSIVSPLVNALSIPWMSFISTPLALVGGLLQQNWAVLLAADSLQLQRQWLIAFHELNWAAIAIPNQPFWIHILVGIGCLILIMPPGIISRWIGVGLLALIAWPAPRPKIEDFWITLMDVGQGTSIAIQTEKHLLIYDAGPAYSDRSNSTQRVLLPWMASQGYERPNLFMLSHDDADHSGGAPLLIKKAPPVQFASSIDSKHILNQLAINRGSKIQNCQHMKKWVWDGVHFEPITLHTPKDAPQKMWAKNNQSCVLRISNSQHSVLLTGDIEAISEMHLLSQHGAKALKARVLVVPHHGSKTSSTEPFLKAVRPEIGLIQAGWENQFGHPHKNVVERYESMNIELLNTAHFGAMQWRFHHNNTSLISLKANEIRKAYWHMHETSAKIP
jgi:competence protein ComEC